MKKITAMVLAVMLIFSLATCASGEEPQMQILGSTQAAGEENNVIYAIRKNGVLRVGTAGDYLPMSYLDPETNTYS